MQVANTSTKSRRSRRRVYTGATVGIFTCLTLAANLGLGGLALPTSSAYAAGAVANAASTVTVDDAVTTGTNHFGYAGASWTNCGGCASGAYQNAFHYAYTTGDNATFTFTGTQANLYGFKEPAGGIASVSVDGAAATDANFYGSTTNLALVYASPTLTNQSHTITVTVSGRTNGGYSPTISLDKAVVTSGGSVTTAPTTTPTATVAPTTSSAPAPSATVDDSVTTGTNHFGYTGASWTNCGGCNAGAYQNAFHYAYTTGDKATFTFTGTQANLYGFKEPAGGIASISVDGAAATDANFYGSTTNLALVYASPTLGNQSHTVTVTVTGRTNGGYSPTISLDKAVVTGSGGTVVPTTPVSSTPTTPVSSTPTTPVSSAPTTPVSSTPTTPTTAPTTAPVTGTGTWLSGESANDSILNGSFAAWRGRSVEIGGTWGATSDWASMEASPYWTVGPDGAWANTPRMDYAMNAFPDNIGSFQNWSGAASGAYDGHWTTIIQNLKAAWGSRAAGNMYIRFAHEMNGNWYGHSVPPAQIANFKAAWIRISNIVKANFPGAKLVWSVNHDNAWPYSMTDLWPGDAYVDVVSMDSYNNYPWCNDAASCTAKFNMTQNGGPAGLETLRQFAQAHGKPFAVSEWSSAAVNAGGGGGDAPGFFQAFHDWLTAHGGTGPGQVIYEVLFNTPGFADHYELFVNGAGSPYEPLAAAKYRQLW